MNKSEKDIWTSRAARFVRAWTQAYTVGLSSGDRAERIAEIDSDLWELRYETEETDIMSRLVRGIPSDLIWLVQMIGTKTVQADKGDAVASARRIGTISRGTGWAFRSLAVLIGVLGVLGSAGTLLGHPLTMNEVGTVMSATILLTDGFVVMVSALILARRPWIGAPTLLVGTVVFSIAWQWTIILPVAGGVMALLGLSQAYGTAKRSSDGPAVFTVTGEG